MDKILDNRSIVLPIEISKCRNKAPALKDVRAVGNQVLVEMLSEQETLGTNIIIQDLGNKKNKEPQGYVLSVGPSFDPNHWGYNVGDRVFFSAPQAVPCPKLAGQERDRFFIDPHTVKGVLIEEKPQ